MTDLETLEAVVASQTEMLRRLAELGNHDLAGPDHPPEIVDIVLPPHPSWLHGWWQEARIIPAHPGRIGGPISPFAIVDHTTDMLPDEWDVLLRTIGVTPGKGNAFHFVIGRNAAEGVVQCVPIDRNANHAGGPEHGEYQDRDARHHPNLVAVGIEIHCAGGVRQVEDRWRLVEDGKAHGLPIPDSDVIPDPLRPGRGWHRVTDYQYERLGRLHADLEHVLAPMPPGLTARSLYEAPPSWAVTLSARIVGHVNLDAKNRSDPWPQTLRWLRGL